MTSSHQGIGRITDKTQPAVELAQLAYTLQVVPPSQPGGLYAADLGVDVPWRMGMEWQRDRRTLVLEMTDGKFIDFAVTTVTQDSISVTALSGPREQR